MACNSGCKQGAKDEDKEVKWEKLHHAGVLFPPEYSRLPSNVKMLYEGEPVELTDAQEEVANMFGIMKETDYMKKQIFLDNFWNDFRKVLDQHFDVMTSCLPCMLM